jgi:hypothetical protein
MRALLFVFCGLIFVLALGCGDSSSGSEQSTDAGTDAIASPAELVTPGLCEEDITDGDPCAPVGSTCGHFMDWCGDTYDDWGCECEPNGWSCWSAAAPGECPPTMDANADAGSAPDVDL